MAFECSDQRFYGPSAGADSRVELEIMVVQNRMGGGIGNGLINKISK